MSLISEKLTLRSFMQNPLVILLSIVGGGIVGMQFPKAAADLQTYGDVFLAFLELCFIPLILASVTMSVHHLVQSTVAKQSMIRIVIVSFGFMALAVMISLLAGFFLHPGETVLSSHSPRIHDISLAASVVERQLSDAFDQDKVMTFGSFILSMVPRNIVVSLANSKVFQIVVFGIVIGVTLGFIKPETEKGGHRFFEALYEIFQRIIYAISIALPLGIFCLMAGEVAKVGPETILPMGSFIVKAYIIFAITFILSIVIIKTRSHVSYVQVYNALKESWYLAFGTRSSIIPIPAVIEGMVEKMKFSKDLVQLMVPLGNVMGRFGNMIYFAFVVIFTFELYRFSLSPQIILMLIPMIVLAGIGTAGTNGVLTLAMLGIVLDMFQLPLGAIMSLLIAVDTLIEPGRTLLNVVFNSAAISVICPKPK